MLALAVGFADHSDTAGCRIKTEKLKGANAVQSLATLLQILLPESNDDDHRPEGLADEVEVRV